MRIILLLKFLYGCCAEKSDGTKKERNHTEQFVYKQNFKDETAMIVALMLVAEKRLGRVYLGAKIGKEQRCVAAKIKTKCSDTNNVETIFQSEI